MVELDYGHGNRVESSFARTDLPGSFPIALGTTEATVYRWGTFKFAIPERPKLRLSELLDCTVSELMGWK